jgi:hypothetical protein
MDHLEKKGLDDIEVQTDRGGDDIKKTSFTAAPGTRSNIMLSHTPALTRFGNTNTAGAGLVSNSSQQELSVTALLHPSVSKPNLGSRLSSNTKLDVVENNNNLHVQKKILTEH